MAGADGIHPALLSAFLQLQAAAAQAGFNIGIGSGFRTPEEQAKLRIKNGCPDVYSAPASSCRVPTAVPGSSQHNFGLAIDITGSKAAKAWANANAGQFGMHFPVAGEDWHIELVGTGKNAGLYEGAGQMGGIGFNLNWAEQGRSPEETQDALISSYMDAITGAQQDELLSTPSSDMLSTAQAPELASPELGQDLGTEPSPQQINWETQVQGGQPGAAGGGGQWGGGAPPPPGYVPPGEGVGRWRDVAIAALRYTNQDPGLVDVLLRRMAQESGGDPTAVNNWDSNAKRGDPSKGLMQNIGSAFPERARELANRGIFDGFANIVASIRYTLNRYGDLTKGWTRAGGY